jgi:hypothetical protein
VDAGLLSALSIAYGRHGIDTALGRSRKYEFLPLILSFSRREKGRFLICCGLTREEVVSMPPLSPRERGGGEGELIN